MRFIYPVSNKLVRQAFEYAIDKQALADAVMAGYAQVGSLLALLLPPVTMPKRIAVTFTT